MHDQDNADGAATAPLPPIRDRTFAVNLWAASLIALAMFALALPFIVLLTGERPPAREFLWAFSMGLGFGALALAALQFALTGRLRWLTHPFGADIVYLCHRYLSWAALALMLAHFGILYIWYQPVLGVLNPLEARWELTSGRVALACFLVLVISSQFRKSLKLPYEWWRYLHVGLAVIGFAAAIAHVLGVGTYTAAADKRALWIGVTIGWVGLLAWSRIGRPWLQARNPWIVTANEAERGGVHTLKLAPQRRGLKHWKPGQFAWLSIGRSPWALKEHPFTISSPPETGPDLSFSIKPLGDDTARLVEVAAGTRAYLDGPYGAFSIDREQDAAGFVMVAGGIGITPIFANLKALTLRGDPRPVILFYANKELSDASFKEEFEAMRARIDLTIIHVPEDPPEGWEGEAGFIDAQVLDRHLPRHSRNWPHLICGPGPMLAAVRKALQTRGVPLTMIDTEVFELV